MNSNEENSNDILINDLSEDKIGTIHHAILRYIDELEQRLNSPEYSEEQKDAVRNALKILPSFSKRINETKSVTRKDANLLKPALELFVIEYFIERHSNPDEPYVDGKPIAYVTGILQQYFGYTEAGYQNLEDHALKRMNQENMEALLSEDSEPRSMLEEMFDAGIDPQQPAQNKYFYAPLILDASRENILIQQEPGENPQFFASKVIPGKTLLQAVTYDLDRYLDYDGGFQIEYAGMEEAPDAKGNILPRVAVRVILEEECEVESVEINGIPVQWMAFSDIE